jgi:hypothetical protein
VVDVTTLPDGDPRHGRNGYTNLGCRCPVCTEAQRVAHRAYMYAHPEQEWRHNERNRELRGSPPRTFEEYMEARRKHWSNRP